MKTHPPSETLGFFDVELRVTWPETKGNPLSRLEALLNLIHDLARSKQIVRRKLLPPTVT